MIQWPFCFWKGMSASKSAGVHDSMALLLLEGDERERVG